MQQDKSKDLSPITSDYSDDPASDNEVSTVVDIEPAEEISTPSSPIETATAATTYDEDAWDIATHMSRLATMKNAEAQALYE